MRRQKNKHICPVCKGDRFKTIEKGKVYACRNRRCTHIIDTRHNNGTSKT